MNTEMPKQELFKTLLENFPLAVLIWEIPENKKLNECKILFVSEQAEDVFNREFNNLVGQTVGEVFPQLANTLFSTAFKRVLLTKENERIISFLYGEKDTPENYFRVELIPLSDESLGVAFINISHQVKAEKDLNDRLSELELVNKSMVNREMKMVELKEKLQICINES
jgi:PAS domain-containing protein